MSFPQVRFCLVCEDVRPEAGGKVSLLGVFGAVPNVEIKVQHLDRPLDRLMFYMVTEKSDSDAEVRLGGKILDPEGAPSITLPSPPGSHRLERGKTINCALGVGNLTFKREGQYTFVFLIDGKEHFNAPFSVQKGVDTDFR